MKVTLLWKHTAGGGGSTEPVGTQKNRKVPLWYDAYTPTHPTQRRRWGWDVGVQSSLHTAEQAALVLNIKAHVLSVQSKWHPFSIKLKQKTTFKELHTSKCFISSSLNDFSGKSGSLQDHPKIKPKQTECFYKSIPSHHRIKSVLFRSSLCSPRDSSKIHSKITHFISRDNHDWAWHL